MTIDAASTDAVEAVERWASATDEMVTMQAGGLTEEQVLQALRATEKVRRQLEAIEHRLITQVEELNLPGLHVMRSTSAFLAALLNLAPREAALRVRHAHHLSPRLTVTGQRLEPILPLTAGAQAAGSVSAGHATVIINTIDRLPVTLGIDEIGAAEAYLAGQAEIFDPPTLAGIGRQLVDTLDPDGALNEEAAQARRRQLSLAPGGDGMFRLTADLDAGTAALAQTVLHALASPQPSEAGVHDERTGGQRLHDAFRAVLKLALRSDQLPRSGGIPATVLITMTAEQFATGTGLCHTSYGQRMTVGQALRIAGEASIGWVVHNSTGAVIDHGRTKRIATEGQTLALIARDKGCTFPSCTAPPEWTERHHIVPGRRAAKRTEQPHLALRPPSRSDRNRRLDHPHAAGHALVHPTQLDRSGAETSIEQTHSARVTARYPLDRCRTPRLDRSARRQTDLGNLTLLCDDHHDRIETGGWTIGATASNRQPAETSARAQPIGDQRCQPVQAEVDLFHRHRAATEPERVHRRTGFVEVVHRGPQHPVPGG